MAAHDRKTTLKPKSAAYDVAEHLRTAEEMAAYLEARLDEAPEDASGMARARADIARAKGMNPPAAAQT